MCTVCMYCIWLHNSHDQAVTESRHIVTRRHLTNRKLHANNVVEPLFISVPCFYWWGAGGGGGGALFSFPHNAVPHCEEFRRRDGNTDIRSKAGERGYEKIR
jgi:hypothetical protein